jgi:hypothetical protein
MDITPPQLHMHLDVLLRAGLPLINTFGEPGAHGEDVTGMHGMGVSTPDAAEVADATVGLAREVHIPKGGIFAMGMWSIMVAAIILLAWTGAPFGMTTNELGAKPKVHINVAPMTVS